LEGLNRKTIDGVVRTPPMGWMSWNAFGRDLDGGAGRFIGELEPHATGLYRVEGAAADGAVPAVGLRARGRFGGRYACVTHAPCESVPFG